MRVMSLPMQFLRMDHKLILSLEIIGEGSFDLLLDMLITLLVSLGSLLQLVDPTCSQLLEVAEGSLTIGVSFGVIASFGEIVLLSVSLTLLLLPLLLLFPLLPLL